MGCIIPGVGSCGPDIKLRVVISIGEGQDTRSVSGKLSGGLSNIRYPVGFLDICAVFSRIQNLVSGQLDSRSKLSKPDIRRPDI